MDNSLEFIQSNIIYLNSLLRRECPTCFKIYLRENENETFICNRCGTNMKFFKINIENDYNEKNNLIFKKMVMKIIDKNQHIRAINFIGKLNKMNNREYLKYLNGKDEVE
jgi:hypothetical protein